MPTHLRPRLLATPAVLALLAVAGLAACTATDASTADPGSTRPASGSASASLKALTPSLRLSTDPGGQACRIGAITPSWTDLAFAEIDLKADGDLMLESVEALGARGVRLSTDPTESFVVPPVNPGGRIVSSGTVTWADWRSGLPGYGLDVERAEEVQGKDLSAGDTGLLVVHLRVDPEVTDTPRGAELRAVRVAYTSGGSDRTAVVTVDQHWYGPDDCPTDG